MNKRFVREPFQLFVILSHHIGKGVKDFCLVVLCKVKEENKGYQWEVRTIKFSLLLNLWTNNGFTCLSTHFTARAS